MRSNEEMMFLLFVLIILVLSILFFGAGDIVHEENMAKIATHQICKEGK